MLVLLHTTKDVSVLHMAPKMVSVTKLSFLFKSCHQKMIYLILVTKCIGYRRCFVTKLQ